MIIDLKGMGMSQQLIEQLSRAAAPALGSPAALASKSIAPKTADAIFEAVEGVEKRQRKEMSQYGIDGLKAKRDTKQEEFKREYTVQLKSGVSRTAALKRAANVVTISESTAWKYAKALGFTGKKKIKNSTVKPPV